MKQPISNRTEEIFHVKIGLANVKWHVTNKTIWQKEKSHDLFYDDRCSPKGQLCHFNPTATTTNRVFYKNSLSIIIHQNGNCNPSSRRKMLLQHKGIKTFTFYLLSEVHHRQLRPMVHWVFKNCHRYFAYKKSQAIVLWFTEWNGMPPFI